MSSYTPYQWTNRNSEHPYRRTLTNVNDTTDVKTVDVTRAEGRIDAQGDSFDANTMNAMEGRIASAFSTVDQAMGNLNNLTTQEKSSLVGAINEVAQGGGGGGSSTLAGLTDTSISSPTNGQVLKYNSTSSKWENAEESGGGENYILFSGSSSSTLSNATTFSLSSYTDQDGNSVEFADLYSYLITNKYAAYLEIAFTDATIRLKSDCPYATSVNLVKIGFHLIGDLNRIYTIALNYSSQLVFTEIKALSQASDVYYSNSNSGLSSSNVQAAIDELASEKADLASPAFTGNPTAPTQSKGNSSTRIATTAFVNNEIDNDTKYHAGDSFSLAGTTCLFLQTGTSARITVPLCKPVGSDVTAAVNSGNWEIRDCNGSTTNGDKTTSGHPLSYYVTTPSSDLKVNIGTNTINILMSNLKASTWGSTSRYTVGSAYANGGNSITFS